MWLEDTSKLLTSLQQQIDWMNKENARLREENSKLKSGIWKEEEVKRLKNRYDRMNKEYYRGFPISDQEAQAIDKWKHKYLEKHGLLRTKIGASGTSFHYEFYPTPLGTVGKIVARDDSFTFQELG